jgi:hypothetical protein
VLPIKEEIIVIDLIISIVFYLIICLALVFFGRNVDNNRKEKFFLWMIILTLTFVSGLRHQSVGIDTQGYIDIISKLRGGYIPKISNVNEQGFLVLSYILVNVSKGYTLALLAFAFITNALIIFRLYDYKDKISLTWAIFIYYMIFYFTSFNTIRQWLAMAIVFFATKYIGKNTVSNIIYISLVVLAISMHTTAVFAIFFLPLYYLALPSNNRRHVMIKICMIIVAIFIGSAVYTTIINRYSSYISSSIYGDMSAINIVLLLFLCFIILYDNDWKITIQRPGTDLSAISMTRIKFETFAFFIGIVLTLMVFFTRYADRVGQYFLLFEVVVFPYYINKKRTRLITITFVVLLCVYLRFSSFLSSGYGEIPYVPFWF